MHISESQAAPYKNGAKNIPKSRKGRKHLADRLGCTGSLADSSPDRSARLSSFNSTLRTANASIRSRLPWLLPKTHHRSTSGNSTNQPNESSQNEDQTTLPGGISFHGDSTLNPLKIPDIVPHASLGIYLHAFEYQFSDGSTVLWLIVNVYCESGYEGPSKHTPAYIGELRNLNIELTNQGSIIEPVVNGSPHRRLRPGETWTVVYCFELGAPINGFLSSPRYKSESSTYSGAVHGRPVYEVVSQPREPSGLGRADLANGYRLHVHCQHSRLAKHNHLDYPMNLRLETVLSKSQERNGPRSFLEAAQQMIALLRYAQDAPGLAFHVLEVIRQHESLVCGLIKGLQLRANDMNEHNLDEELEDLLGFYQSVMESGYEPQTSHSRRAYARRSTLENAARPATYVQNAIRNGNSVRPCFPPNVSPTVPRRNSFELDRTQYPVARILGDVTNTLKRSALNVTNTLKRSVAKWKVPAVFQRQPNSYPSKENNRISGAYGVLDSNLDVPLTTLNRNAVESPTPLTPELRPMPSAFLRPARDDPNFERQSVYGRAPSATPSPAPVPAPLFSNYRARVRNTLRRFQHDPNTHADPGWRRPTTTKMRAMLDSPMASLVQTVTETPATLMSRIWVR